MPPLPNSTDAVELTGEPMFRIVVEAAPTAIIVADHEGRMVLVNPATLRLFGYAGAELLGQPVEMLVPIGVRHDHAGLRNRYLREPEVRPMGGGRDLTGLRRDGSEVPIEVALNPIGTAAGVCVLAMITDITERKRAEEGRARLAALVGSSNDAIIGISLDGLITDWNSGAVTIFDRAEADVIGRPITVIVPPDLIAEEAAMLGRVWAGQDVKNFDTVRLRRDGTQVPVSLAISPIRDGHGRVIGASKILRDVTERQQADQALRQANETLEQRVGERTRELAQQLTARRNAEAALAQSQKMEAVGQLTGGIAHDFNNLLTVFSGNLHFILEMATSNDRLRRLAGSMQRAVERAARLTGQLLAFARRQPLLPEVLHLDRVIDDFSMLIQRALGETVQLHVTSEPSLWACEIDPSQLEAAVLNLALNARDAMPDGGQLVIAARNVQYPGGDDLPAGKYVAIAVTDTGRGMTPAVLQRAVEPFFTTKDVGKGSGLGLSQAYGFARQSDGTLRIDSKPGQGTRITMLFPRARSDVAAPADRAECRPGADLRGVSVLVVEDNADLLDLMHETLLTAGVTVLGADDGAQALTVLDRNPEIALVVSDIVLPNRLSGVEVGLEARRRRPGLPVLLMSGYPNEELVRFGGAASFPFLAKPFQQTELIGRLTTMLNFAGPQTHGLDGGPIPSHPASRRNTSGADFERSLAPHEPIATIEPRDYSGNVILPQGQKMRPRRRDMHDGGEHAGNPELAFSLEEMQTISAWSRAIRAYGLAADVSSDHGFIDEVLLVFEGTAAEPSWMIHKTPDGAVAVRLWPGVARIVPTLPDALAAITSAARRDIN